MVAYGALLPQSALDIPEHGWVNLHFSCLPAWRGAAPVQHSIWAGDEVTGATTFRIVKEMDAGPTYGVMTERIRDTDTAGDLLARLAEGGAGSAGRHPRRDRGRQPRGPAAAGRGHVLRAEDHRRGRAGRLARSGDGRGPPDPGLHARARRLDDLRRHAGQARSGDAHRRAAAPGRAGDREDRGAGRDRHDSGAARRREGLRVAPDGGGRLGARAPAARAPLGSIPRSRPGTSSSVAP